MHVVHWLPVYKNTGDWQMSACSERYSKSQRNEKVESAAVNACASPEALIYSWGPGLGRTGYERKARWLSSRFEEHYSQSSYAEVNERTWRVRNVGAKADAGHALPSWSIGLVKLLQHGN